MSKRIAENIRRVAARDYRLTEVAEAVKNVITPQSTTNNTDPKRAPAPPLSNKQSQMLMLIIQYGAKLENNARVFKQKNTSEFGRMIEALGKAMQGKPPQQ